MALFVKLVAAGTVHTVDVYGKVCFTRSRFLCAFSLYFSS
jgi:hypothetical protein